jgi:hypothetical protein
VIVNDSLISSNIIQKFFQFKGVIAIRREIGSNCERTHHHDTMDTEDVEDVVDKFKPGAFVAWW